MARNPDEDVANAIATRWESCAALVQSVPGGLEQDRLTEAQPGAHPKKARSLPYAMFKVSKLQDPELCTGGQAIHHAQVVIEVYGRKPNVEAALEILWQDPATSAPVFARQTLVMDGAVGRAAMAVLEMGGTDELRKDAATKDADDLWVGEHQLHVMHHRQL